MLAQRPRPALVIDCWRCLDAARLEGAADYIAIGVGPRDAALTALSRVA